MSPWWLLAIYVPGVILVTVFSAVTAGENDDAGDSIGMAIFWPILLALVVVMSPFFGLVALFDAVKGKRVPTKEPDDE